MPTSRVEMSQEPLVSPDCNNLAVSEAGHAYPASDLANVRDTRERLELELLQERLDLLDSQRALAAVKCQKFTQIMEAAIAETNGEADDLNERYTPIPRSRSRRRRSLDLASCSTATGPPLDPFYQDGNGNGIPTAHPRRPRPGRSSLDRRALSRSGSRSSISRTSLEIQRGFPRSETTVDRGSVAGVPAARQAAGRSPFEMSRSMSRGDLAPRDGFGESRCLDQPADGANWLLPTYGTRAGEKGVSIAYQSGTRAAPLTSLTPKGSNSTLSLDSSTDDVDSEEERDTCQGQLSSRSVTEPKLFEIPITDIGPRASTSTCKPNKLRSVLKASAPFTDITLSSSEDERDAGHRSKLCYTSFRYTTRGRGSLDCSHQPARAAAGGCSARQPAVGPTCSERADGLPGGSSCNKPASPGRASGVPGFLERALNCNRRQSFDHRRVKAEREDPLTVWEDSDVRWRRAEKMRQLEAARRNVLWGQTDH